MAWKVFLYPFSNEVWILLALYGLLGALVIRLIYCTCHTRMGGQCAPLHKRIIESLSVTWSVFCSYLGGKPPESLCKHDIPTPLKMAVFSCFFFGTVVWAAYRASLTSELVDTVDKEPFDSLQSFLESDYQ